MTKINLLIKIKKRGARMKKKHRKLVTKMIGQEKFT